MFTCLKRDTIDMAIYMYKSAFDYLFFRAFKIFSFSIHIQFVAECHNMRKITNEKYYC